MAMKPKSDRSPRRCGSEKIQVETRGLAGLPRTHGGPPAVRSLPAQRRLGAQARARADGALPHAGCRISAAASPCSAAKIASASAATTARPIEQMLPVRMEHEDRQDTPSVALLVVLDRSGSMTAQVQGQTKMSLADQGAVFAMNVLQPKDYFGVLAVDTRAHVVVPLAQLATRQARRAENHDHHRGRRRHLYLHVARRGLPDAARHPRAHQARHPFFRCCRRRGKERRRDGRRCARRRHFARSRLRDGRRENHHLGRRRSARSRTRTPPSCASSPSAATAAFTSPATPPRCRRFSPPRR